MRNKVRLEAIRFDADEGTTLKIEVRCWPPKQGDTVPFDPRPLLRAIKDHMDQEDADGNQG